MLNLNYFINSLFKLNDKIKKELSNSPSNLALITINPNFEELIGISPSGSNKPYKAFKYVKDLVKEAIDNSLKSIIDYIFNFEYDLSRETLEELNIEKK
ncbi:MAG: hypothetical protein ACTSR8_21970 [Promethearchaeota archaeon]